MTMQFAPLHGTTLVDVVDLLYADQVKALMQQDCGPHHEGLFEHLKWSIENRWWEAVWLSSEPSFVQHRRDGPHFSKNMWKALDALLLESLKAIIAPLAGGTVEIYGFEEADAEHGQVRTQIPTYAIDAGHCLLERNGSRVELRDAAGVFRAWNGVLLSGAPSEIGADGRAMVANDLAPYSCEPPPELDRLRYRAEDWPLLVEVRRLVKTGGARSARKGVGSIDSQRVAGHGDIESRLTRLRKAYGKVQWDRFEQD